jgi:polygalacturonase
MKFIAAIILSSGLALSGATFDVREFGAIGDGKAFDTGAIQKALDACQADGGTVEFRAGTYLSRPLTLHANTTVRLDAGAILQASTNQADFMKTPGDWTRTKGSFIPFISGRDLTNVTFTGSGVIEGGGSVWWGEAENARRVRPGYTLPRPNLISLEHCNNVRLENITLQNSPKFHFLPADCEDVVVSNVTILAPEHAANTDAIDPSGRRILITHCTLDVGDDNVAIKAGKKVPGHDFESEDITVTDCTFLHGHGVSIGSETAGGVRNVTVRNCTFENTENGLRIKSDVRRGGVVEDISYDNITMSNVTPAITLTCIYQNNSAGDSRQSHRTRPDDGNPAGDRIPSFRNIRFSHLTATCPSKAGMIMGLLENCITNVVLENVQISAGTGFEISNARCIQFKNSTVTVKYGPPLITNNAEVTGLDKAVEPRDGHRSSNE